MKYLILGLLICSLNVFAETLITANFTIDISHECEEGVVSCDRIKFTYSPTGFEKKQVVIGSTVHTKCADGVTPCAFQGYEFLADGAKYRIYNSGVLKVLDENGNQLLLEQGEWQ